MSQFQPNLRQRGDSPSQRVASRSVIHSITGGECRPTSTLRRGGRCVLSALTKAIPHPCRILLHCSSNRLTDTGNSVFNS